MSRYSKQELRILRNEIPIDVLIKDLGIPCKEIEGYFRFCCPACRQYNSSVLYKKNLARCFRCEKNFNTIDIVEIVRGSDFINSVEYLIKYHKKSNKPASVQPKQTSQTKRLASKPLSVGQIIHKMIRTRDDNSSAIHNLSQKNTPENLSLNQLNEKLQHLERKVEYLIQKLNQIELIDL